MKCDAVRTAILHSVGLDLRAIYWVLWAMGCDGYRLVLCKRLVHICDTCINQQSGKLCSGNQSHIVFLRHGDGIGGKTACWLLK